MRDASKRRRWRGAAIVSGGVSAALAIGIAFAIASPAKAKGSGTNSTNAGLTELCSMATQETASGNPTGFMSWVEGQCKTTGPAGIVSKLQSSGALGERAAATPSANGGSGPSPGDREVGALMCSYAEMRATSPGASATTRSEAALCKAKPSSQPQPTRALGIQPVVNQIPFAYNDHANNMWNGTVGGKQVELYAGSQPSPLSNGAAGNPTLGVVTLVTPTHGYRSFNATRPDGPLTVTAEANGVVTLTASDGATYQFGLSDDQLTRT